MPVPIMFEITSDVALNNPNWRSRAGPELPDDGGENGLAGVLIQTGLEDGVIGGHPPA
jgi:hypothetical protein